MTHPTLRPFVFDPQDPDTPARWAEALAIRSSAEPPLVLQIDWKRVQADALTGLLPPEECARLLRLRLPEDRLRFAAGRGMLRRILGAHFRQAPERVDIRTGPFGKPFAPPHEGVAAPHFNLAHAGEAVLLAVSPAHEVGVDVEVAAPAPEWALIAPRLMLAAEHQAWLGLPPPGQTRAFCQAWTRYEAGAKALGLGLADDFSLPAEPCLERAELDLPAGYAGALAWWTPKRGDSLLTSPASRRTAAAPRRGCSPAR